MAACLPIVAELRQQIQDGEDGSELWAAAAAQSLELESTLQEWDASDSSCSENSEVQTFLSFDVGFRNLAFCGCRVATPKGAEAQLTIEQWDVCDIVEFNKSKAKTKSIGMERLCRMMVKFLSSHIADWYRLLKSGKGCTIVIEQQLSRSQTMKMLQYTLMVFFQTLWPVAKIKFCHAKHKLTVDGSHFGCETQDFEAPAPKRRKSAQEPTKKVLQRRQKAEAYRFNKLKGIWLTERILKRGTEEWCEFFDKNKKQDDLADCLLQALANVRYT